MKALIVSDTHENGKRIKDNVKFAKKNGIETVFDAGDLHGAINEYGRVNLHAVYWGEASGGMERWRFSREVESIGGVVHENGSGFRLEDMLVFMQHNLANYEKTIPQERLDDANKCLDSLAEENPDKTFKRFIFFGHTHNPHFNNDGRTIAINPGYADGNQTFAVLDSDQGTIEYRTKRKVLLKVNIGSEIIQAREFDTESKSCILRLRNGKEVFRYFKGRREKRTEEFYRIVSAHRLFKHGINHLKVEHEDYTQQLIIGDFRSRKYKRINETFTEYDEKGENTGRISSYIAVKEIEGLEKQLLVVGEEEKESIEFDKINIRRTPIIHEEEVVFIGETKVSDEKVFDEEANYVHHLVVNDRVRVTYKSIEDLFCRDGKIIVTAKDKDKKSLVSVVNPDGSVEEGRKYDSVDDANYRDKKFVNGKLVYIAKENGKMFVVVDGEEQVKHGFNPKSWGERLRDVQFIGDKLAYIIQREESDTVFFDGNESESVPKEKYAQGILNLSEVNGRPAYLAKAKGQNSRIIVDGKAIVDEADIDYFVNLDGRIVYQKKSGGCFSQDGTRLEGYDRIGVLMEDYREGKFSFPGEK